MAMIQWQPLEELRAMQEEMNRLLPLSRARLLPEPLEAMGWQPPVDIFEDERELILQMEVPGVAEADIQVEIRGDRLVVAGERKREREARRHTFQRIECKYGPFRRSFQLPAGLTPERIGIGCVAGILTIILPKASCASLQIAAGSQEPDSRQP